MKFLVVFAFFAFAAPVLAQEAASPQTECVRITAVSATLRGRPLLTAKALDIVAKNAQVEAIARRDAWVLVQSEDYVGWVETKLLEPCVTGTVSKTPVLAASPANQPLAAAPPQTAPASSPAAESRTYTRGPRGGCFYINSSGRKVYVDHGLCG
jgi:hypothetical protein